MSKREQFEKETGFKYNSKVFDAKYTYKESPCSVKMYWESYSEWLEKENKLLHDFLKKWYSSIEYLKVNGNWPIHMKEEMFELMQFNKIKQ